MTMLVYPQLTTGALSQFPVRKQRRLRTVINRAADGSVIKLADANAERDEWSLQYTGLSDAELAALQQFFTAAEGSLNGFTFLDPSANLLAWSDHLDNAVWVAGPQLTLAGGVQDPAGGTSGWHLTNAGAGAQNISQTLGAPAGYQYCLSAYVRAAQPASATLLAGSQRSTQATGAGWTRLSFRASGDPTQDSITFGLEVAAGAALDVYGMQAEPQAAASLYRSSTTGGVYENARLKDDTLTITTTDTGLHSCKVNIYYAKHL